MGSYELEPPVHLEEGGGGVEVLKPPPTIIHDRVRVEDGRRGV